LNRSFHLCRSDFIERPFCRKTLLQIGYQWATSS
jgi:hypothetical protein